MSAIQPPDRSSGGEPAEPPELSRLVKCQGCGVLLPRSDKVCGRCGSPNCGHPSVAQQRAQRVLWCALTAYVLCFGFALVGWLMARRDLAQIEAGLRHPSARGTTEAARQLALWNLGLHLVGAVLLALGLGIWIWIELQRPAGF
ncbi:MAG: hypothetical protein ACKOGA_01160 [Planctomycetaceae bacterium]